MTRRRRILMTLGGLAVVLVLGWWGVRELIYSRHLPPAVKERMPGHWGVPWGLRADVRAAIDDLYSGHTSIRIDATSRLANLGPDAAPAVPFLVALLADDEQCVKFVSLIPFLPPPPPPPSLLDQILEYWSQEPPDDDGQWVLSQGDLDQDFVGDIAAYSLADIGEPAALPLIAALADPEPKVRFRAALALGIIGDRRAALPLIAVLESDPNSNVRARAAEALGLIGDARAVPALLAELRPEKTTDYKIIMEALGRIAPSRASGSSDDPQVIEPLLELRGAKLDRFAAPDDFRAACCEVLLRCGDPGIRAVLANLIEPDTESPVGHFTIDDIAAAVRNGYRTDDPRIIQALLRPLERYYWTTASMQSLAILRPASAVEPLLAMLNQGAEESSDSDKARRTVVAETLGYFNDPRIADALAASLAGPEPRPVRRTVALALARFGDPRAVPLLAAEMEGDRATDYSNLTELADALGRIKTEESTLLLVKLLGNPHDIVFLHALEAISDRRDPRAAPLIVAHLRLLAPVSGSLVGVEIELDACGPPAIRDALVAIGQPAVPHLLPYLGDSKQEVRSGAAEILGRIGGTQTLEPLLDLFKNSPNAGTVIAAAEALGRIGDARATAPLIEMLKTDPSLDIGGAIIEALGRLKNPQATDAIMDEWRSDAARVAGRPLDPLTEHESSNWGAYLCSLIRSNDPRAFQAWKTAINPIDDCMYIDGNAFLSGFGPKDIGSLVQAIRDCPPKTSLASLPATALLVMDDPAAYRALCEVTAAQPRVRGLAMEEIVKWSDPATVRRVLSLIALQDADRMNRLKAVALLVEWVGPDARPTVEQVAAGDPSPTVRLLARRWVHLYFGPDAAANYSMGDRPQPLQGGLRRTDPLRDVRWDPAP